MEGMIRPDVGIALIASSIALYTGVLVGVAFLLAREFRDTRRLAVESVLIASGPSASEIDEFVRSLTPAEYAEAEELRRRVTGSDS